jgi:hypothetical protein
MPRPKVKKRRSSPPAPRSRKSATKADVAREQGVCIRTVNQWMAERKIPFRKISPRVLRFDLDAVAHALDRYTVKEVK